MAGNTGIKEQREKLLRFYRNSEGEDTAVRLVDLADAVAKNRKYRLSLFLDPFGQEIAETVVANFDGLRLFFEGGYQGAERMKAVLMHEEFEQFGGTVAGYEITCVEATWNSQFAQLSHRDVLGSLMGLGIERETVGDILVASGVAKIIVDSKIADFIVNNLQKIGNVSTQNQIIDLATITPREERVKEIRATVASLRLDSIVAAGFSMSRTRAAGDIDADKVKLNWQSVRGASKTVKEGDVISMRGRGRLEVTGIKGTTKKGRTVVELRRFY